MKKYLLSCIIISLGFILIFPVLSYQEIVSQHQGQVRDVTPNTDFLSHMAESLTALPVPARDILLLLCTGFLGVTHIRRKK